MDKSSLNYCVKVFESIGRILMSQCHLILLTSGAHEERSSSDDTQASACNVMAGDEPLRIIKIF